MTNSSKLPESSVGMKPSPRLLIFGNPLLDITVQISDDELLKKYQLEVDGQKEVPLEELGKLIGDAKARYKTLKFSLGGSGLNSSRILAALNQTDLMFFGAIGADQNGDIVREILVRSNVRASLQQLSDIKTGTCVCLCQGEARSLTANIGAALKAEKSFIETKLDEFDTSPKIYYIEGFFIPEKMHICRFLHEKYAAESESTVLVTNLNAPYIVKAYPEDVTWLSEKADILFGNRDEFEELAKMRKFTSMEQLISEMYKEYKKSSHKIIVITDGSNPVLLYRGNSVQGFESESVKVPKVRPEEIIDTTGSGDSFVAGFLHELMEGKEIRECIEFGCEISAKVIRVLGCNLPKD